MNRITNKVLIRDTQIFYWVYAKIRNRILNMFMMAVTKLGGAFFSISFSLFLIIFYQGRLKQIGWELIISLASSHLVVYIIKRLVNRTRPYKFLENIDLLIAPLEDYSFPSGHTAASFTLAVIFSLNYPELRMFFISLAALVGISRIYLGVHYPSDVIIGALIGTLFSYLNFFLIFI